jgi:hypothetical protein
VFKRKFHRRFTTHRMPDEQALFDTVILEEVQEIGGHARIVDTIHMWRTAVISLVECIDCVMSTEYRPSQRMPVTAGAKQSV